MKILGIDHGKNTGFGFIDCGKLTSYGRLIIEGESTGDKMLKFYSYIYDLVEICKPDIIVAEMPNHLRNAKTSRTLIGYYMIIHLIATMKGIHIVDAHPTSLKKVVAGDGRASKEDVAKAIAKIHDVDIENILEHDYYKTGERRGLVKETYYDTSDAIALATYAKLKGEKKGK